MSLSFQSCPHIGSQNPNIQISIVVNGQLLVISCKRISPCTQSDPFPIKYKVKLDSELYIYNFNNYVIY